MKYAVVIEKAKRNYSAYVPDLPGCVSTGKTVEAARRGIGEAIEMHVRGMIEDGEEVPEPRAVVGSVSLRVGRGKQGKAVWRGVPRKARS